MPQGSRSELGTLIGVGPGLCGHLRISLLGTSVNKGMKKAGAVCPGPSKAVCPLQLSGGGGPELPPLTGSTGAGAHEQRPGRVHIDLTLEVRARGGTAAFQRRHDPELCLAAFEISGVARPRTHSRYTRLAGAEYANALSLMAVSMW